VNFNFRVLQVFPDEFATKPSLHGLLHLSTHARRFGSLRNVSVATKEMVHRLYKGAVPATDKRNLQRDLIVFESVMQAIRFTAEGAPDLRYSEEIGGGTRELLDLGLFDSEYITLPRESPTQADDDGPLKCNESVTNISLAGRKWTSEQIRRQGLPELLSDEQMGELAEAYHEQGVETLMTVRKVTYHDTVVYTILGADTRDSRGRLQEAKSVRIRVRVGDILEVLDVTGVFSYVKVIGIMHHEHSVFLVVVWLVPTGRTHPRLHLPEYKQHVLFEYAGFFSLTTVDHPQYVNGASFQACDGKLVRNEWIFHVV
jgi:hypothetical protein